MAQDNNFDGKSLKEFTNDNVNLGNMMNSLIDMQQKMMKTMSKNPDDISEEELQNMSSELQSENFQDLCKNLMGMQQKYMGALTGEASSNVIPSNDDMKHLALIRRKVDEVVDKYNDVVDSFEHIDQRITRLEKQCKKLSKRYRDLENRIIALEAKRS